MITIIFLNHIDIHLDLLVFLRPILLLDLHDFYDSFNDVFNFEKLQLLSNALMETFIILHENHKIVDGDSKGDYFFMKFSDIVID